MKKSKIISEAIKQEIEENAPFVTDISRLQKKLSNINFKPSSNEDINREARFMLPTLRNRNLITPHEQNKLRKTTVGFFGLSVGSHAALTWMMLSRADDVKIIDPDTVSPSNLNRIRTGWNTVGKKKIEVVKKQLLSIHPDARVLALADTSRGAAESVFDQSPGLDIVVEEIDDLSGKVLLRQLARKRRIPILSATDVGDNVLIDIERYDLDHKLEIFLGRIKSLDIEQVDLLQLSPKERIELTMEIVGMEYCSKEMISSLLEIGRSLKTWPQLGTTATIAGGAIATTIKKIVLGEKVKSGRYVISLDSIFARATG